MNEKTAQWLRSIKIPPGHINEGQLQNGYLFGLIFDKLNLSKDKKFKNSQDLACIFQNFKNTKDLLYDHFGIAFPANEIIYRSSQLLQKVKQACEEYEKNKKQSKLSEIKKKYLTTNSNQNTINNEQKLLSLRQNQIKQQASSTFNANRTFSSTQPKLPQKILQIQKKLSKFKDQQTRHQLLNLQTRKQQLDSINQAIQDHRYFQMSKLRMNHQMRKQFERKVADVVAKTQEKKLQRIQKEQQFFRFMKSKKDNFYSSIKQQENNAFVQGLDDFQLNCLRQGIELQHDPNKPYVQKQDNFNSKVMLQRIRDNTKKMEHQRKQRQKRANSKFVQTSQANIKSQKVWQQNYLVDRLQKNMQKHWGYIQQTEKTKLFQQATKDQLMLKMSKKTFKPLPEATQQEKEEFEAQLRANRLVFYDKQIQRLEKKDKFLKGIAQQALQSLLYTVIVAEESQKNMNFSFSEWKDLQKTFVSYQVPVDDKRKKQHSEIKMKEPRQNGEFLNYLQQLKLLQKQAKDLQLAEQKQFAQFIDSLIQKAYPKHSEPSPTNLPLHMPLRIGMTGNRLSGKTTQVKKLLAKYPSLVLIDPKRILTEALQLAKPPAVNEDAKKKKQSKKPQQQTPQRLQLKKFGQQLLNQLKTQSGQQNTEPNTQYEALHFKYIIKAIKFKLLQSFKQLTPEQQLNKYNQCHEQQNQRIKDFEKNQEQKSKKKDSKKGPATQIIQQSPVFNEFFYVEGFVIDNVNLNEENLRQIEKQLNGFVKVQERLNDHAQNLRQQFGQLLPISKSEIPTNLNEGFFNILINLDVSPQSQQQRNQGRKMDPQTGQIYHPKFCPHPTDVKGLAERLVEVKKVEIESPETAKQLRLKKQKYYSSFGYESKKLSTFHNFEESIVDETNSSVVNIIENSLKVQYQNIKMYQRPISKETEQIKQGQASEEHNLSQNPQAQETPQNSEQIISLNQQSSQKLLKRQQQINFSYKQSVCEELQSLTQIRMQFQSSFLHHQREFVEIITRPDDKANRILTFQDNYNKLLEEKSNIINDQAAISHLVSKLDQLYDSLWVNIESKKNQAIQKRKSFMASNWLNSQVQRIVQVGKNVLQAQMDYLVDILAFIIKTQLEIQGKTTQPVVDYLCLGIPSQSQPIESIIPSKSQITTSPRLQFYINQAQQCLNSLSQWYSKKQTQSKTKLCPQLQNLAQNFITNQRQKLKTIIKFVTQMVYQYAEEQVCYFNALINKMDDWIIVGIKEENQFTYNIYKDLKSSIGKITKSQLKDLFPTPITFALKPIQRITHSHQLLPNENTCPEIFNYSSYKIFLEEIKCLSSSANSSQMSEVKKNNFNRLKQYINKRRKSKLLSQIYLNLDFDTMQQYLVTDNEVNFKELAIAMLLWNVNVLDQQSISLYAQQLSRNEEHKTISSPSQLSISPLFPSTKLSRKQTQCIQHLLFDIMENQYTHQVTIKQYIDLLNSFNSLQLFKYGDSIMMLNEQKAK